MYEYTNTHGGSAPVYLPTGSSVIYPNWINFNTNKDKVWCGMKLLLQSQTSTIAPLGFGNGYVNSTHISLDMWQLIHAGININLF